jgi:hypothetical protein
MIRAAHAAIAAASVLLLILGWIDFVTGYEFGFFIFYFLPVSMAAWWGSRRTGLLMAVAAAIAWYLSDRLSHHPYSNAFFLYWETFMRLVSFLTTAYTIARIRELGRGRSELETALRDSTAENAVLRHRISEIERQGRSDLAALR